LSLGREWLKKSGNQVSRKIVNREWSIGMEQATVGLAFALIPLGTVFAQHYKVAGYVNPLTPHVVPLQDRPSNQCCIQISPLM